MPGIFGGLLDERDQEPGGILSPVIWDRLRNQQTLNPYTTEGAGRPYVGGATKFMGSPGMGDTTAETPSGLTMGFYGHPMFPTVEFTNPYGNLRGGGTGAQGTERSINRFTEVGRTLDDYIDQYKPDGFRFSPLSPSHEKLYNKLAPMLAKRYGGTLSRDGDYYVIELPK